MADIKEVQKQLDAALAANKDLAEKNAALQSSNDLLAEEKDVLMKSLDEVTADRDALKSEVARLITTPDEKETESGVGGIFEVGGSKYQVLVPSYNIPGYYFAVGGSNPIWIEDARKGGRPIAGHHSPLFRIDPEPSVRLGTEAMVAATLELLKPKN